MTDGGFGGIVAGEGGKPSPIRRIVREPLVHFVILGGLIFALFSLMGGDRGVDSNRIVIDNGVVADILERYSSVWQRAPTEPEMRALVDDYIKDEILYRQGVAMGLEGDDPVIRRRIRQKLDVITEESRDTAPATDAELQAWLTRHADQYGLPPELSFDQVYFDPSKRGAGTAAAIDAARSRLASGADPAAVGDVTMLPSSGKAEPADLIARDFGDEFVQLLVKQPIGQWAGPIPSGFGLHLVRITERKAGRTPSLAEVRAAVQRDWENDRRQRASQAYYDNLRKDYKVVVTADLPPGPMPQGAAK